MEDRNSRYCLISVLFFAVVTATSCAAHRIHYVLPDGYVGIIKIVRDDNNGLEVKNKEGKYILEVPAHGVLKLKNFDLFDSYEFTAAEKTGKEIPIVHPFPDDGVALRDTIFQKSSGGPELAITIVGNKTQTDKMRADIGHQSFVDVDPAVYNQQFRSKWAVNEID